MLVRLTDESKHHLVFLLIELSEADTFRQQKQFIPIITRTSSFIQHVLKERLQEELRLSRALTKGYRQGELTLQELKLAQFIRHCRNDVSHNFWHDTEWSFIIHHHGSVCSITLLYSLLESWYDVGWYVDRELNAENCLRVIEGEFEFEWDEEHLTYEKDSISPRYDFELDLAEQSEILY